MRVQQLRESLGLTREELSEKAGISPQNLAKIENGQRFFSSESLGRIASALNVSVPELFVLEGNQKNKGGAATLGKIERLLRNRSEEDLQFAHSLLSLVFKKIP
mgnify:CR=1 FL=1